VLTLRKSKVLSERRGVVKTWESVVRLAKVEGGRLFGFESTLQEGTVMRKYVARHRGEKRGRKRIAICMLDAVGSCCSALETFQMVVMLGHRLETLGDD